MILPTHSDISIPHIGYNFFKKTVTIILLVAFVLSSVNISYASDALSPPLESKPIAKVVKNGDSLEVVEIPDGKPDSDSVESKSFGYLAGLMARALYANTSEDDLRQRVNAFLSHIDFFRFHPSLVVKVGEGKEASLFLPYRRKDDGSLIFLRYFIPPAGELPYGVTRISLEGMDIASEAVPAEEVPLKAQKLAEELQKAPVAVPEVTVPVPAKLSGIDSFTTPSEILFLLENRGRIGYARIATNLLDGLVRDFELTEADLEKIEAAKKGFYSLWNRLRTKRAFQKYLDGVLRDELALDKRTLKKKEGVPVTAADKYIMALGWIFRDGNSAPMAEPFIRNIVNALFDKAYADKINLTSPTRSYHIQNDSVIAYQTALTYLHHPPHSQFKKHFGEKDITESTDELAKKKVARMFEIASWVVAQKKTYLEKRDLKRMKKTVSVVDIGSPLPVLFVDPSRNVVRPLANGRRRQVIYLPRLFLADFDINDRDDMNELTAWVIYALEWNDMYQKLEKIKTSPEVIYSALNSLTERFTIDNRYGLASPARIRQHLFKLMKEALVRQSTMLVPELLSKYEEATNMAAELEKDYPDGYVYGLGDYQKAGARYTKVKDAFAELGLYFDLLGIHELGRRFYAERAKWARAIQRYEIGVLPVETQMELLLFSLRHGDIDDFIENLDMLLTGKEFPLSPYYPEEEHERQLDALADFAEVHLPVIEREVDYVLESLRRIEKDPVKRMGIRQVQAIAANMIKDFEAKQALKPKISARPRPEAVPAQPVPSDTGAAEDLAEKALDLTSGIIAESRKALKGETDPDRIKSLHQMADSALISLANSFANLEQTEEAACNLADEIYSESDRQDVASDVLYVMASRPSSAVKAYNWASIMINDTVLKSKVFSRVARTVKESALPSVNAANIFAQALVNAQAASGRFLKALALGDVLTDMAACGMLDKAGPGVEEVMNDIREADPLKAAVVFAKICPSIAVADPLRAKRMWYMNYPPKAVDSAVDIRYARKDLRYAMALLDAAEALSVIKEFPVPDAPDMGLGDGKFFEKISAAMIDGMAAVARKAASAGGEDDALAALQIFLRCAEVAKKAGEEGRIKEWVGSAEECIKNVREEDLIAYAKMNVAAALFDLGMDSQKAEKLFDEAVIISQMPDVPHYEGRPHAVLRVIIRMAPYNQVRKKLIALADGIKEKSIRLEAQCAILEWMFKDTKEPIQIKDIETALGLPKDRQPPPGEPITGEELAKVTQAVLDASPHIREAVSILERFRSEHFITRYYITGSFATGWLKSEPNDIDIVVSLRQSHLPPESDMMGALTEAIDELNRRSPVRFHLNTLPFGRVFAVDDKCAISETGEMRSEQVLERMPEKETKILIDLSNITDNPAFSDEKFFTRLYRNIVAHFRGMPKKEYDETPPDWGAGRVSDPAAENDEFDPDKMPPPEVVEYKIRELNRNKAEGWDISPERMAERIRELKQAMRSLTPEARTRMAHGDILLIGPGRHIHEIEMLFKLFPDMRSLSVVDIDTDNLSFIESRLAERKDIDKSKIKLYRADCSQMPFEDGKFDACYSHGVLEESHGADAETVYMHLSELTRVLKRDGVYLTLWSTLHFFKKWGFAIRGDHDGLFLASPTDAVFTSPDKVAQPQKTAGVPAEQQVLWFNVHGFVDEGKNSAEAKVKEELAKQGFIDNSYTVSSDTPHEKVRSYVASIIQKQENKMRRNIVFSGHYFKSISEYSGCIEEAIRGVCDALGTGGFNIMLPLDLIDNLARTEVAVPDLLDVLGFTQLDSRNSRVYVDDEPVLGWNTAVAEKEAPAEVRFYTTSDKMVEHIKGKGMPVAEHAVDTAELEVATRFLDTIKVAAFNAKQRGENIMIALETNGWIPECQKGVIQPLISQVYRLKEELGRRGMDNIVLTRGSSENLAAEISRDAAKYNVAAKNMVVLASENTLGSKAFDGWRSTETEYRAFFAGVDPKNIEDLSYIQLLEMLTVAMKLAFRDTVGLNSYPDIIVESLGKRIARLIPKAGPKAKDIGELKDRYEMRRKALEAAA